MRQVRWGTVLCAAVAAAIVGAGCGGSRSKVKAPDPQPPVARKVSGVLLDAATGRLVLRPVKLSVRDATGALSPLARDGNGNVQSQLTASTGVFGFAVDPAAPLPVRLTVVATTDGYFTGSGSVELAADGEQQLVIRLVSVTNPPEGVATVQWSGGTAAGGVVPAAVTVKTQDEQAVGGATKLAIPANTRLTAADGTPLQGEVRATVSYFAATEASALAAFPGGLDVALAPASSGGAPRLGSFVAGGFAAIEIADASGKLAASFDPPVAVTITVAPGTINPETGVAVKVGDTVPFWSYSETTGQWRSEGTLTVQANGTGGLEGVGSVSHLSYFSLAWWQDRCGQDVHVVVSGNPERRPLVVKLDRPGGGYHAEVSSAGDPNDVVLRSAPSGVPVTVTVEYLGAVVGQVSVPDVCSAVIPVTVHLPAIALANLDVAVYSACVQDVNQRSPEGSATVAVYRTGQMPSIGSTDGSGAVRFGGLGGGYAYNVSVKTLGGATVLVPKLLVPGENQVEAVLLKDCQPVTTGATGGAGR